MKFTLAMLPSLAYYTPLLGTFPSIRKALSPTTFSLRLWFWFAMPKALRLAFRVTFLVLLWKSGTKILFFQKPHANFQRIVSLKSTDISIILLRNTSFIFHENSFKSNFDYYTALNAHGWMKWGKIDGKWQSPLAIPWIWRIVLPWTARESSINQQRA